MKHIPVLAWPVSSSLLLSLMILLLQTNAFTVGPRARDIGPLLPRLDLGPSQRLAVSSLSSTTSGQPAAAVDNDKSNRRRKLTDQQIDFVLGYLNKHQAIFLLAVATSLSAVADEMARANTWSGGSYAILNATASAISSDEIALDIVIQKRGGRIETRLVHVPLNPAEVANGRRRLKTWPPPVPLDPDRLPIDDVCRKLSRLAWLVGQPDVSGKLIQLAVQLDGAGLGKLPENMQV
jgi:hypothetical protein